MIKQIAIILAAVVAVYFFPVSGGEYTDLHHLRENSYCSAALIAIVALLCRGWWMKAAIIFIECLLISSNLYLANFWHIRDQLLIAEYYTQLQDGAFYIELAIIGTRIITGLRAIGADIDSVNNWLSAHTSSSNTGEHRK